MIVVLVERLGERGMQRFVMQSLRCRVVARLRAHTELV